MRTNPTWGQLDKSDEARRQKLAAALAKRDNIKIDSVPAGYAHLIDKAVDGFKVMKERQSADRMTNTTAEVFGINTPIAKQPSITPTKSEPKIDIVPTRKVAPEIEPMKKSDAGDLNFNLADLLDSGTEAQPAAKMMANALDSPAEAPVLPAEPMEPNKLAYTPAPQAIGAPEPIKLADAIEPPRPPADIPPQVDAFSAQNAFSEPTRASATLPGSGVNQQRVARILSSPVGPIVERVANETGYPVEKVATFVDVESSGNPNAKTGRYAGLLQLDSKKFGDQVYDPEFNLRQGIKGLQGEESRFANNYGRPPTVNETYMGHQQGEGGLRAHLSNPDAPAWQNMASTGEGRQKGEGWARQAIWGNVPNAMKAKFGSVDNITSKDFMDMWRQKVGGPDLPNPQQPASWQTAGMGGMQGGIAFNDGNTQPYQVASLGGMAPPAPRPPQNSIPESRNMGLGMSEQTAQASNGPPPQQVAQNSGVLDWRNVGGKQSLTGGAPQRLQPPQSQAPQAPQGYTNRAAESAQRQMQILQQAYSNARTPDEKNYYLQGFQQAQQAYTAATTPTEKTEIKDGWVLTVRTDPNTGQTSVINRTPQVMRDEKRTPAQRQYHEEYLPSVVSGQTPVDFTTWERENKRSGAITGDTQDAKNRSDLQFAHYKTAISNADAAGQFNSDLNQFLALQGELKAGPLTRQMYDRYGTFLQAIGVGEGEIGKVQGMEAIVARLGPKMRAAGSGATSDWEGRQFLKGLPALANTNEGNAIISSVLTNMNDISQKRAMLAARQTSPETAMPFQNYIKADQDMVRNSDPLSAWREWSKSVGTYQAPDIATQRDEEMRRRGLK